MFSRRHALAYVVAVLISTVGATVVYVFSLSSDYGPTDALAYSLIAFVVIAIAYLDFIRRASRGR